MASKNSSQTGSTPKTLYRSETNRVIGGVAGGLGEYFEIDPTIVRIIFVLLTIFGGSGVLIYILLWILLPSKSASSTFNKNNFKDNIDEIKNQAKSFAHGFRNSKKNDNKTSIGILILLVGIILLLDNLGLNLSLGRFWPLILIALGFVFLTR